MTILNGSFETQATGGQTGDAEDWAVVEVFTAEEYAEFASNPSNPDTSGQETFDEGWFPPLDQEFVADFSGGFFVDIQPAFFDGGDRADEDFEHLWGTTLFAMAGLAAATFDGATPSGPEDLEDFEEGWDAPADALIPSFGPSDLTFALFDAGTPQAFEDLEEEWEGNESYLFTLPPPTFAFFATSAASLEQLEGFEGARFDLADITVDATADTVIKTAHGLLFGYVVTFRNEGGRVPEGILANTNYFVFTVNPDDFQVRAVAGGPAIDIVDDGFGSHFVVHDPAKWWIDELTGV